MSTMKKGPTFTQALVVFLVIVAVIIFGLVVMKVDAHVLLILGTFIAAIASLKLGYEWKDLEAAMCNSVCRAMSAMFIFILIGMVCLLYTSRCV